MKCLKYVKFVAAGLNSMSHSFMLCKHLNKLILYNFSYSSCQIKRDGRDVNKGERQKAMNLSLHGDTQKDIYQVIKTRCSTIHDVNIRRIRKNDLNAVSRILTDAFFSYNIFSTPFEFLKTYLSLKDSLEETNDLYCIWVACKVNDNSVIGICEVDARLTSKPENVPRPYVCNLAVDIKWRKQGIGRALMKVCEDIALRDWKENFLHLRVRSKNKDAMVFYESLGYIPFEYEQPGQVDDDLIIFKKKLM